MNPFTFNIETYHKKNGTTRDSCDLLVPGSAPLPKGHKLQSAIKFLGGLAARKAGVFLVGGILAVGCTVHFLGKGRKRRTGTRLLTRQDGELRSSRSHVSIQTDPLVGPVRVENKSTTVPEGEATKVVASGEAGSSYSDKNVEPAKDLAGEQTSSSDSHMHLDQLHSSHDNMLREGCGSVSTVSAASDDLAMSESNCISNAGGATGATQTIHKQRWCCNLSTVLALYALHKALMCERSAATNTCHCEKNRCASEIEQPKTKTSVFNPGATPTTSAVIKQEISPLVETSCQSITKAPQEKERDWMVVPSRPTQNEYNGGQASSKNASMISPQPFSPDLRPNPFGTKSQDAAFATSRNEAERKILSKSDPFVPRAYASQRPAKSIFGLDRSEEKDEVTFNAVEQQSQDCRVSFASSSDRSNQVGRSRQRGKPRRRGAWRKNIYRQQNMVLDDPKPIASQHRR